MVDGAKGNDRSGGDRVLRDPGYAGELAGSSSQLPERRRQRKDAVLGVGTAPAGLVEVGDFGRSPVAGVIEERVEIGQAKPAADKDGQQQERAQPAEGLTHATSLEGGSEFVYRRR